MIHLLVVVDASGIQQPKPVKGQGMNEWVSSRWWVSLSKSEHVCSMCVIGNCVYTDHNGASPKFDMWPSGNSLLSLFSSRVSQEANED